MIDSETIGCHVNEKLLHQFEITHPNVIIIGTTGGLVIDIASTILEIEKFDNPIIFIADNKKDITSEYNIDAIINLKPNKINDIVSINEPFIEKNKKYKGYERPYKYHR